MNGPTVTASVIYNDAGAGINWLTEVLGLTLKSLYKSPDGKVAFAGTRMAHRHCVCFKPAA